MGRVIQTLTYENSVLYKDFKTAVPNVPRLTDALVGSLLKVG